jgi:hypothetical protein
MTENTTPPFTNGNMQCFELVSSVAGISSVTGNRVNQRQKKKWRLTIVWSVARLELDADLKSYARVQQRLS